MKIFWRFLKIFGDIGESRNFNRGTIDGVVVGKSRHSHKVNRCIMKLCGLMRMRFGNWYIKTRATLGEKQQLG